MATTYEYLQGKAKWCHLVQPDTRFGSKWNMVLYPDAASYDKILALKETPAIMNVIKKDEDGYNIALSRKTSIEVKGKIVGMAPPVLLDGSKKLDDGTYAPLPPNVLIGNGSDVTVKCEVYTTKMRSGGTIRAIRLFSVRVDNLIPFEIKNDFTPEQKELIAGLAEQPEQLF